MDSLIVLRLLRSRGSRGAAAQLFEQGVIIPPSHTQKGPPIWEALSAVRGGLRRYALLSPHAPRVTCASFSLNTKKT